MPTDLPPWLLQERAEVGRRIREARKRRGFSQERLAELAGLDRKTVNRIENATRALPVDYFLRIARALDIKVWRLFTDEEPSSHGAC